MASICSICEKEVNDVDDYTECDSCDQLFHLKCANVLKKEFNARINSKCLRMYCPDCFDDKTNGTANKLNLITKLIYKLDAHNQEQVAVKQKENDTIAALVGQVKLLEEKMSKLEYSKHHTNTTTSDSASTSKSISNVIKRNNIKPAVLIKPKNKQQCKTTFADITKNMPQSSVDVCGTREVRDGGVILRCNNVNDTMKVKQLVQEKLGDNYEIVLPKIKSPRLRISNIDSDIPKDNIIDEIKKHNEEIAEIEFRLVAVIGRKYRSYSYNDIIVEIDGDSYKRLLQMGTLALPWRECRIFDHLHVLRYRCCGFSHKSSSCTKQQVCSQCSGSHKFAECKSKKKAVLTANHIIRHIKQILIQTMVLMAKIVNYLNVN